MTSHLRSRRDGVYSIKAATYVLRSQTTESTMSTRRLIPPPPKTHALSSTTFRPPPLDGSLSVPEMWDWHAEHSANHPLFRYAKDDGSVRTIPWGEVIGAALRAAKVIRTRVRAEPGAVVAIFATSESIGYATTLLGIMRANYVAFPISVRNSPAAVAHLIGKVGAKHLLVSGEQAIRDLVRDALDILKSQDAASVPETSPMFVFEELYSSANDIVTSKDVPYVFRGPDAIGVILHSSGSTAFPKPIYWTQHRFVELARAVWYSENDLTGRVFSLHPLPMFHGMGFMNMMWAGSCGTVLAVFAPSFPPRVPTPDNVIHAAQAVDCDSTLIVPSILETWARNPEYVKWLATRRNVSYAGGPLSKDCGDYLVSQGVRVGNGYGTTEVGPVCDIYTSEPISDWEYFKLHSAISIKALPMGDNTFELVVLANENSTPSVINTKVDGVDGYATSDLIAPHPTLAGYWKILGRTDDQIMHSTGEKTNPGPLENILKQDPLVSDCLMFGRGRFQAGILVEPKKEFAFDASDKVLLAEFRNKIWPSVEKLNAYAPQHSRLFKEMILVAKPSKPFTYTAKGSVRRGAIIKEYEDEIDAQYDAVEESAQSNIQPPDHWDQQTALVFTRSVVEKVFTVPVDDDGDIFEHGCDSLQATWIRNTILRAIRDSTKTNTRNVSSGFIYEYPTISKLASFVLTLASGTVNGTTVDPATIVQGMRAMVAKYSKDFPVHKGGVKSTGKVVLLTGTTGGLGCYGLQALVADPTVSRVYAFNRPARSGESLRERQRATLVDRGLDPSFLESKKLVLLEGDLSAPAFGLSRDVYQELGRSVTHIIHNAWRVDFKISLASFESNVYGVRALVNLALESPLSPPPKLLFTSSIGVVQNSQDDRTVSEKPVDAILAIGNGYTQSKWVSEEILYSARAQTALKPVVIRVGQLCGSLDGSWNAHEWFPSIVQSTPKLGCFPDDDQKAAWIPLDISAKALVDFLSAPDSIDTVHLVHPRPVSWHSLAVVAAQEFSVPLVSFKEWVAKLEQYAEAIVKEDDTGLDSRHTSQSIHAIELIPSYKAMAQNSSGSGHAAGLPDLSVEKTSIASPTLADPSLPQLGPAHVKSWIAYWRRVGLFA